MRRRRPNLIAELIPLHFSGTQTIGKLTRDVIQRKGDNLYFSETVDGYEYYDAGLRLYLQQLGSNWHLR